MLCLRIYSFTHYLITGEALYSIHLSEDDIKLGINQVCMNVLHCLYISNSTTVQGIYVSGILNVNKRRAADTAFIKLHQNQGSVLPPDSKILIKGAINRNRAIHGDTVAVRLFSQSEWEQKRENEGLVPTGEVVGVVYRPSREYVAVFPVSLELTHVYRSLYELVCNMFLLYLLISRDGPKTWLINIMIII